MIEIFRQRFEYDKANGRLIHKAIDGSSGLTEGYIKRHNKLYAGFLATCKNNGRGHLTVTVNNKKYCATRVAWLMLYGEWPIKSVKQINGNKNDLRPENLRLVNDFPVGVYAREMYRKKGGNSTYYVAHGKFFKHLADAEEFIEKFTAIS